MMKHCVWQKLAVVWFHLLSKDKYFIKSYNLYFSVSPVLLLASLGYQFHILVRRISDCSLRKSRPLTHKCYFTLIWLYSSGLWAPDLGPDHAAPHAPCVGSLHRLVTGAGEPQLFNDSMFSSNLLLLGSNFSDPIWFNCISSLGKQRSSENGGKEEWAQF